MAVLGGWLCIGVLPREAYGQLSFLFIFAYSSLPQSVIIKLCPTNFSLELE